MCKGEGSFMPEKKLMTRDTMTGPIATNDGRGYTIKRTKDKWKLIINAPVIACDFVYSKKDLKTFDELKTFLTADGFQVL